MRVETLDELERLDIRHAWRIDVLVFGLCVVDGQVCMDGTEYWEGFDVSHPHECFFDNLEEAIEWCRLFDRDMAWWAKTHGNGRLHSHVCCEVLGFDDFEPGYVVHARDYFCGRYLEEWEATK